MGPMVLDNDHNYTLSGAHSQAKQYRIAGKEDASRLGGISYGARVTRLGRIYKLLLL